MSLLPPTRCRRHRMLQGWRGHRGIEQHPREPRRAKVWATAARKEGRCSGGVLRRRQRPTITTCRFRQGRQDRCQLPMDKGHQHKDWRSQSTMQAPPSHRDRTVNSPDTPGGRGRGRSLQECLKGFSQRT